MLPNEKRSWASRVDVMFQPKAWCGENVMKVWGKREWGNNYVHESPKSYSSGKILVADVHRTQQTDEVKQLLQRKKTLVIKFLQAALVESSQ